jgi:Fibronectin type III domain/Calcineurin-like phosphoesterase
MRTRLLLVLVAATVGTLAPGAAGATTNLLPNGDFEGSGGGSLAGWQDRRATLTLVPGDGSAFGAQAAYGGSGTTYGIASAGKVVRSADSGTAYVADGRFDAPSGATVCLQIREVGSGSTTQTECTTGTGAWADLPALTHTVGTTGNSLLFAVVQKHAHSGDTFVVDNLSLVSGGGGGGTIAPPSNLQATAASPSAIDLSWTASTTGGITGYHVYRNGGATPAGTVSAPATSFQDTGLDASTKYTYTVTAFDSSDESAPSNQASATTQGGGGGGGVTIAAAGDIACNPADPNYNGGEGTGNLLTGHCHQKATADLIAQGSYDRVLALGDLQYDCAGLGAFNAVYDATWGRFNSKIEPVLGNHEVKTASDFGEPDCSSSATGYFTYFANHGVTDAAGVNGKGYYSYDLGSWHVLALDAECAQAGGCGGKSPEVKWIQSDIAAHPNQCTLAYWHQASWSSGTGGVKSTRKIWKNMVDNGVDLVLVGHFHHYERFADLDASGQPVTTGNRTREIIVGTGGESEGSFHESIAGSQVRIRAFGILALTLGSGSYSWQFKPADPSGPTDTGSEQCH